MPITTKAAVETKPWDFAKQQPAEILLGRLLKLASLSEFEIDFVREMSNCIEDIPPGTDLISEGEILKKPIALIFGWACGMRTLLDGRRQIFRFVLPGDVLGSHLHIAPVALSTITTLTPAKIVNIGFLRDIVLQEPGRYPGLTKACSVASALQEAYLLNQVVRLGRQNATQRVAHLLLELQHRLDSAGLINGSRTPLPLTQSILADALGLSIVHVNRTLQQLRRSHLIEIKSSFMRLLEPKRLAHLAEFHPPAISQASVQ